MSPCRRRRRRSYIIWAEVYVVPRRSPTRARRLLLLKPATASTLRHEAPARAMTRESPKRKAPVRWPSLTYGCETRSRGGLDGTALTDAKYSKHASVDLASRPLHLG